MAELNKLMALPGAVAAFEMNDRGELQEHEIASRSDLDAQALDLLGHMCVANMAIATMQARGWEAMSHNEGFYPINGFTLVGMDWSVVTDGHSCVVLANDQADYELAYATLGVDGGEA